MIAEHLFGMAFGTWVANLPYGPHDRETIYDIHQHHYSIVYIIIVISML